MDPHPEVPDLVFTANAGIVNGEQFVPSHFRHPERQGETRDRRGVVRRAGLPGRPAARRARPRGRRRRAALHPRGRRHRARVGLLVPQRRRRHHRARRRCSAARSRPCSSSTRGCTTSTSRSARSTSAARCARPRGWDSYGRKVIEALVPEPLWLEEDEALSFCANSVVVGTTIVMPSTPPRVGPPARAVGLHRRREPGRRVPQGRRRLPVPHARARYCPAPDGHDRARPRASGARQHGASTGDAARAALEAARDQHWLARTPLGYIVTRHADVTAILGDRRFHSALVAPPADVGHRGRGAQRSPAAVDPRHGGRRAPAAAPAGVARLHAPLGRPAATGDAPGDRRPRRAAAPDRAAASWSPTCASRTRSRSSASCSARRRRTGSCSRGGPPTSSGSSTTTSPRPRPHQGGHGRARRLRAGDDRGAPVDARPTTCSRDLIAAEEAGDRLSTDELVMMCEAVLMAGTDTTRNQLACSVALLVAAPRPVASASARIPTWPSRPSRRRCATSAPSAAPPGSRRRTSSTATSSSRPARSWSPAWPPPTSTPRCGTTRTAWTSSARRPAPSHMTLGWGLHHCLGAALARAELQEALPLLARSMPDLEIDGEIEWKPANVGIWGPARLPLRFTPSG